MLIDLIAAINIARFHPLIVHLPIGIMLFAFTLFVLGRREKTDQYQSALTIAIGLAALSSIASIGTGWFLSQEGGYEGGAIDWHKYLGIAFTIFTVLLYFVHINQWRWRSRYLAPLFFINIILLIATGHFGGNLTHGSEYLFQSAEAKHTIVNNIDSAMVYQDIIAPIFKSKCNGCHNPSKKKGELIMTSPEGLSKGGENGQIFDLTRPIDSEILRRLALPIEEEDHMPPEGKRQLSIMEVDLLKWWVMNRACCDCKAADLPSDDHIKTILKQMYQAPSINRFAKLDPVAPRTIQDLRKKGILVVPQSQSSSEVVVRIANKKDVNDRTLDNLDGIATNIVELNLNGSSFDDAMLQGIAKMQDVAKVSLQKTLISDRTVTYLSSLEYLESLNLFGTKVTNSSIEKLKEISSLKHLYLWNSLVTKDGIEALINDRPDMEVVFDLIGDMFGYAVLSPPEIAVQKEIFVDSILVDILPGFKGSAIYYTVDSSDPDSSSTEFVHPFVLEESTVVKAFARKEGWKDSPISSKEFIKSNLAIDNISLVNQPSPKYEAKRDLTLYDSKRGSSDFQDGNWLGYEGEDIEFVVDLGKRVSVQELMIGVLSKPNSWIFFPKKIEVLFSNDGLQYHSPLQRRVDWERRNGTEQRFVSIDFSPLETRFLRIKAKSILKNPSWHPNKGEKSWVFVDEVLVN